MRAIQGEVSYGFIDVVRDIPVHQLTDALEIDFLSYTDIRDRRVYVLENVDAAIADVGVAQEVDLQRVGELMVGDVADDVDEAITDFALDRAHEIGEEARLPFENAEEEHFALAGIALNFLCERANAIRDLLSGEYWSDLLHRSPPSTLRKACRPRDSL